MAPLSSAVQVAPRLLLLHRWLLEEDTAAEAAYSVADAARRDPAASVALRQWLDSLVDEFADRLLPITAPIARQWALLNVPDPVPVVEKPLGHRHLNSASVHWFSVP